MIEGDDAPRAEQEWKKRMDLDLSKIKYEVQDFKKKKGKEKKISPEDKFMMASIQPACHSKRLRNEYFLCVEVEYDGCVCCVDLPDSRMPMTIVPVVHPDCYGFKAPDEWSEATNLGCFNVDLAEDNSD